MPRTFLALAFLCLLGPAVADERAAARQQIEAARQDIAELQKLLKQIEQEKSGVQKQLQTTESEMGQLEKQVDTLQQEIDRSEAELERLNEEKTTLEGARLEQQRLIGLQARAAYQNGRQEYLKLLLNQQNPEKFSRTLTYYDYLNKARLEQLDSFNETLRQLANVEADIEAQQNLLAEKKDGLLERRDQLAEVRSERQQALAAEQRPVQPRAAAAGSPPGTGAVRAGAQDHRRDAGPSGTRGRGGSSARTACRTPASAAATTSQAQRQLRAEWPAGIQRRWQLWRAVRPGQR